MEEFEDTDVYAKVPSLLVNVIETHEIIDLPEEITCTYGGKSIPIVINLPNAPFSDVSVSLVKNEFRSFGIEPLTSEIVFEFGGKEQGVLDFTCAEDGTGS